MKACKRLRKLLHLVILVQWEVADLSICHELIVFAYFQWAVLGVFLSIPDSYLLGYYSLSSSSKQTLTKQTPPMSLHTL